MKCEAMHEGMFDDINIEREKERMRGGGGIGVGGGEEGSRLVVRCII